MEVLKVETDIVTNIPPRPIVLAEIIVIMSVSTLKIAVILYISSFCLFLKYIWLLLPPLLIYTNHLSLNVNFKQSHLF